MEAPATLALGVQQLPIDVPIIHPSNGRKGDVEAIAASLGRFGQVKPIIIQQSTGYVVAGNHTLQAARSLGWPSIVAIVVNLSDEDARAYLIADNRTSDKASYNVNAQADLLSGVLDLSGTGYTIDDVETLMDAAGQSTLETPAEGEAPVREKAPPPVRTQAFKPLREIMLIMEVEAAQEFGVWVRRLQKVYGSTSVADTVRRAVQDCARANGVEDLGDSA